MKETLDSKLATAESLSLQLSDSIEALSNDLDCLPQRLSVIIERVRFLQDKQDEIVTLIQRI